MPQANVQPESKPAPPAAASSGEATDGAASVVSAFTAPKPLAALINQRLTLLMQLDGIERQRQGLMKTPGLPQNAANELARQVRELRRMPNGEMAASVLEKLSQRSAGSDPDTEPDLCMDEPEAADETVDQNEQLDPDADAEADFDSTDPDDQSDDDDSETDGHENEYLSEYELELEEDEEQVADSEALTEQEDPAQVPQADPLYVEALQLGCRQATLFIQRDALTEPMLAAAARCQGDEGLYQLLTAGDCDPTALFGWAAYASALQSLQEGTARKLATVNQQLKHSQGRGSGGDPSATELTLSDESRLLACLQTAIGRELRAGEPVMVDEFWRVYEEAAVLLVNGQAAAEQQVHLRALLRYGIIGQAPWLLAPVAAAHLLAECQEPLSQWDEALGATHVLYADEYIDMVAKGHVTPSIDQDLELNGKGSDPWKADRMWRKIVYAQTAEAALSKIEAELQARVDAITRANQKLAAKEGTLNHEDKDYRVKRGKLRNKIQANKVESARFQRGVELIEQKYLLEQQSLAGEAQTKLAELDSSMTPEMLARRESAGVRQVCKLCAKLKEPFLPFVMRDQYKRQGGAANDRQTVVAEIGAIEQRDPNVFRDILVHHKKPANRIYIRYSPYIVLVPTQGIMGISWNPRSASEVGRLVLPALNARPGALARMLYEVMADFRFDTSKEDAGVDLLTSETLVAAYATVRWDYRKRSKEIREKAAIYNDENDRKNWRRHYALHISSALDGGKKLFFKCPEVYEAVCKHMGLPAGVDKLE